MTDLPPPPPFQPPPFDAPPPGAGGPDAGDALSYGWAKFQANVGPLIVVVLIQLVVQVAMAVVGRTAVTSLAGRLALFQVVAMVVNAVVGIGIFQMALMITAGQTANVAQAFRSDRWVEWILFSIVFGFITGFGLVLCLIPGLVFLAFLGLAPFYFLDGRLSLGPALSASLEVTRRKELGFQVLLSIVVGGLGFIACFLGALVTLPIGYVAVAYLYGYAAGQPVAA